MPATDTAQDVDRDRERDRDRVGGDPERLDKIDKNSKQKSSASAAKSAKDLSHVPCKFFKVGACTAGSSCPFSHNLQEPGGQKETCTWFVKGNCKFGHKCALAHILPGQTMAMDRKNKKAAQQAAAAAGGKDPAAKMGRGGAGATKRDGPMNGRVPLLAGGSTAPTRPTQPNPGRPPMTMPLKATISPSAPAPPLKDTDFASFSVLDDIEQLPVAPAQGRAGASDHPAGDTPIDPKSASPTTLPVSAPRSVGTTSSASKPPADFGPIGSPPRASPHSHSTPLSPTRLNGSATTFSPGTSPRNANHNGLGLGISPSGGGFISTSPFSAPGNQTVFMLNEGGMRGGIAKSLGSGVVMGGGRRAWGGENPNNEFGSLGTGAAHTNGDYHDVSFDYENEDLEDFLPSSLTDLLTPEERSRRMSRSGSGQTPGHLGAALEGGTPGGLGVPLGGPSGGMGHRYSRSVPAPSLLGDIRSIWADNAPMPGQAPSGTTPMAHPSSPSRAHLGSQQQQQQQLGSGANLGRGLRNTSSPLFSRAERLFRLPTRPEPFTPQQLPPIPIRPYTKRAPQPQPVQRESNQYATHSCRSDDASLLSGDPHQVLLSPSTRALQSHAPGQSLPQGLAAGYSRLHALPPLPHVASPGSGLSASPGLGSISSPYSGADWSSTSPTPQTQQPQSGQGLDSMFSRMSFSAAAAAAARGPGQAVAAGSNPTNAGPPPGLQRNVSGARWGVNAIASPLSGPVVTRDDDDDLFSMDG
ncbi:hypothetical protein BD779DRAFT_1581592 [Infundibulicybe gibba]|nr:hypothetical protein BD779DRAFT_1581592 [Infundibulicybe gibba]